MKIEITPKLLAELKEKAKMSSPGEWIATRNVDNKGVSRLYVVPQEKDIFLEDKAFQPKNAVAIISQALFLVESYGDMEAQRRINNANYIAAANPAVMLALIEKIEILENDNNLLKQTIKNLLKH